MIQIKGHKRSRKNGVTVVKKHSRKSRGIAHPTGKQTSLGPYKIPARITKESAVALGNRLLKSGKITTDIHNNLIKSGIKLHRGKTGNKYTK
jgi:hypothetical protein